MKHQQFEPSESVQSLSRLLGQQNDQGLAFATTTTRTFGNSTQKRFIHLHFALQPITPWPNHGPPEFRQQSPSGLIASQAQHPLQSQSARAILLTRHIPQAPEPNSPWFVGVLKNRPCRYRSLGTTVSADPSVTLRRPCRFCVAARTIETIRPTQFKQVFTTGCLGREFGFKIQNSTRKFIRHANTLLVVAGGVNRIPT